MTKKMEVYKCDEVIIEVIKGEGCCSTASCHELSCCGKPMTLQPANTVDAAREKHVPVLEPRDCGVLVKIGSEPHPMTEKHYIMWVEVVNGDYVNRKYLHPGEAPEAPFYVGKQAGLVLRTYCNLHGLWESKV
ncbi:MAG: desulfoferrodoxin family protein [Victivallaceae bacterium]|nr:desulfoferrodoxin family protein [Victivallaceae bacterium]